MRCPFCRQNIPDPSSVCPVCGRETKAPDGNGPLEPELVEPERTDGSAPSFPRDSGGQTRFTRIFYTTFPGEGLPPACLPTVVTFALALVAAFQFGVLAAIGFLVFAGIGRAVTFFLTIRHFLEGRLINPWAFHILTWLVCWLLVAWLSGNL